MRDLDQRARPDRVRAGLGRPPERLDVPHRLPKPVALERCAGRVVGEAIHLDDDPLRMPDHVDLVGTDPRVDASGWKVVCSQQLEEPLLGF